jgi:hypothetical protein
MTFPQRLAGNLHRWYRPKLMFFKCWGQFARFVFLGGGGYKKVNQHFPKLGLEGSKSNIPCWRAPAQHLHDVRTTWHRMRQWPACPVAWRVMTHVHVYRAWNSVTCIYSIFLMLLVVGRNGLSVIRPKFIMKSRCSMNERNMSQLRPVR